MTLRSSRKEAQMSENPGELELEAAQSSAAGEESIKVRQEDLQTEQPREEK